MNEILAQWWALLSCCALIVWAVNRSNIGEYDCVDVEYTVKDTHLGGTYCDNPYYERLSKDVKVCD